MKLFLLIVLLLLCCNFVRDQVGGAVLPGEFPYVVRLRITSGFAWRKETFCSGAIVDKHWILTAASCVNYWKTPKVEITTGKYFMEVITADKVFVDEDYASDDVHDIALLWLKNGTIFDDRTTEFAEYRPNADVTPRLGEMCIIFVWNSVGTKQHKFLFNEQAAVMLPIKNRWIRLRKAPPPHNIVTVMGFSSGRDDIVGPISPRPPGASCVRDPWLLQVQTLTGNKVNSNNHNEWIRMGDVHRDGVSPSWSVLAIVGTGAAGMAGVGRMMGWY